MEVEGGRGDKEGIEGQVMSAPRRCADAIKKDIVVPDQAGDRSEARVDHWDRGVPIVDVVEHPDVVGLSCSDFTADSMSCKRGRLCRGHIILVCRIIENIHVLASVNCDPWAAIIVSNVIINLNSSPITGGFVAINNNSFSVRNFAGVSLIFITDIILIVIKYVVVHKNFGSRAPVTVGTLDGNAASV